MSLATLRQLLLLPLILGLGACATPGAMLSTSVGTIRTGMSLADEQAQASFVAANAAARWSAVERKIRLPANSLAESDFPAAVDAQSIEQWRNAFGLLDRYLAGLQGLVGPERAAATGAGLTELGTELGQGVIGAKLPGSSAQMFTMLGSALVQAQADRKAQSVMRRADPAFQQVTAALADAIGADDQANLRGTVRVNWNNQLAGVTLEFARLTVAQPDARTRIVTRYLALIDQRDGDLNRLASLRTSLLALGEAHAAAARGDGGSALYWVGRIASRLEEAKAEIAVEKEGLSSGRE